MTDKYNDPIDWRREYGLVAVGASMAGFAYGSLGLWGAPFMLLGFAIIAYAWTRGETRIRDYDENELY